MLSDFSFITKVSGNLLFLIVVVEWEPFNDPEDSSGYLHIASRPPSEVLVLGSGQQFRTVPLDSYTEGEKKVWLAQYEVWKASRKLKDIYLECGWDVNSQDQEGYRRDEFLGKRNRYWEEVVQPLHEMESQLIDRVRLLHMEL